MNEKNIFTIAASVSISKTKHLTGPIVKRNGVY